MPFWGCDALVKIDVSEERIASIIRVAESFHADDDGRDIRMKEYKSRWGHA
jgi:hypothetical protein